MITIFPTSSVIFTSNGIGSLRDAISCLVTEERNGVFELELEYPITGSYYSQIFLRRIIVAKPNPYSEPQPFRIFSISKPINGIVTINANHISYDTSGYPASPFNATSIQTAFVNMKNASAVTCPFTFSTNKETIGELKVLKPTSIRSLLGKEILDIYQGEYEFDNFNIKLHENRGQNRGASIRYGKNLIDLRQEENCKSVYTGVYPYWYTDAKGLVQLTNKVINAPGTYDFTRIYPLDLTQLWSEPPTPEQLLAEANLFMVANDIGIPEVSIDLSFVELSKSEEYKNFATLETVKLCDQVTVEFAELGVMATAKCIKTVYDVLTNRYETIGLGDAQSNIATTISDGIKNTSKKIEETNIKFSKEVDTIKIGLADIDKALIKKADIEVLEAGYAHIIDGYIDMAQIKEASITDAMIDRTTTNRLIVVSADIQDASISNAKIDRAGIDKLVVVTADIQDASISNAKIDRLSANKLVVVNADIESIDAGKIDTGYLNADRIESHTIVANRVIVEGSITVDLLDAESINVEYAHISNGSIDNAKIDVANVNYIYANYAHITTGIIDNAKIDHSNVNNLYANYAHIVNGKIDNATIDVAEIINLYANYAHISEGVIDNATISYANVDDLSAHYAHIADGFIDNASIKIANISDLNAIKISSDQFTSNIIDTSKVTILGTSGKLRMANNRIQVFDDQEVPVERASMGDVNGDGSIYGLRIRGADGVTMLLDEDGVHNEGISDGAITNDKISTIADIEGSKLLDNSVEGGKIVIDSITARQIAFQTITGNEIDVNSIKAEHIQAGAVTANKIDTKGLNISTNINGIEINTFSVDSLGKVEMAGVVRSYYYNSSEHKGWCISPEGDAEFNNAIVRGKVILPNAGITNDGDKDDSVRIWAGNEEILRNEAPFRVLQNGSVFINDGNFTGKITGGSIDIGNIHISDTNSTNAILKINSNGDISTIIQLAEDTSFINTPFSIGSTLYVNPTTGVTQLLDSSFILKQDSVNVPIKFNNTMTDNLIELANNSYNIKIKSDGSCAFSTKTSTSNADFTFQRLDANDAVINDDVVVYVNGELSVANRINMQTMYIQKNVSTGGIQFIFT